MLKFIKRIIFVIILVILFAGTILTYRGYQVYKEALNKISVADKVAEIKQEENYAELKELPEFYLNAVIAVEDSKYGLIAATRALIKTYMVPDIIPPDDECYSKAYKILNTLEDFIKEMENGKSFND